MKSIQGIFDNSLFRIPDYQRGYSWAEQHLDDLWQDLANIRDNHIHYTGAITVERVSPESYKRWEEDLWVIEGKKYIPYYVVDGQQRLTSIIILLFTIIESISEEDELAYETRSRLFQKYIRTENERKNLHAYLFGYEIDDPSYEFLKTKIFGQISSSAYSQPETVYTNNLAKAKDFFEKRIINIPFEEKELLFKKVTQQLVFDFKVLEDDLDMFVVFETMNNRGKSLSNLEKLKNRLIYLSSLLQNEKDEKTFLRSEINNVWKTIYEFLGKNKKNILPDDAFLRTHFIMYYGFNKEKDFPNKDLFKDIFTVKRTVTGNLSYGEILSYVQSIQQAAKNWFIINNPSLALSMGLVSPQLGVWLDRLNRIRLRVFGPILMAAFCKKEQEERLLQLLEAIESYNFLIFNAAGRRSNTGNPHFYHIARHYHYSENDWSSLEDVIENINLWVEGDDEYTGYYSTENFINYMKDFFVRTNKDGYYSWPGLKYLLHEYEEHLRGRGERKTYWETPNSIEHIAPQSINESSWKVKFPNFTPKERTILSNSLGNLLLLSGQKNSELSNKDFIFKKRHPNGEGGYSGYFNGSYSEIEVSQSFDWKAEDIVLRGLILLDFMEDRWAINLGGEEQKLKLLLHNDKLEERFKGLRRPASVT